MQIHNKAVVRYSKILPDASVKIVSAESNVVETQLIMKPHHTVQQIVNFQSNPEPPRYPSVYDYMLLFYLFNHITSAVYIYLIMSLNRQAM